MRREYVSVEKSGRLQKKENLTQGGDGDTLSFRARERRPLLLLNGENDEEIVGFVVSVVFQSRLTVLHILPTPKSDSVSSSSSFFSPGSMSRFRTFCCSSQKKKGEKHRQDKLFSNQEGQKQKYAENRKWRRSPFQSLSPSSPTSGRSPPTRGYSVPTSFGAPSHLPKASRRCCTAATFLLHPPQKQLLRSILALLLVPSSAQRVPRHRRLTPLLSLRPPRRSLRLISVPTPP